MITRIAAATGLMLAMACAAGAEENDVSASSLRPPGDPERAVRGALEQARRARTVERYDLFIARHGDHPLGEVARRERDALVRRQGTPRPKDG